MVSLHSSWASQTHMKLHMLPVWPGAVVFVHRGSATLGGAGTHIPVESQTSQANPQLVEQHARWEPSGTWGSQSPLMQSATVRHEPPSGCLQ